LHGHNWDGLSEPIKGLLTTLFTSLWSPHYPGDLVVNRQLWETCRDMWQENICQHAFKCWWTEF